MKAVVVAANIITPFGPGIDALWEGILANRTAIARMSRFSTAAFVSDVAGIIPGLIYHGGESLVMQMLTRLFGEPGSAIPDDTRLLLATTKGEIDYLERSVIDGVGDVAESSLDRLLAKTVALAGVQGPGMTISAACTSSALAAARAAAMIRNRQADSVLVVACDAVTEFVYSGFSSLMALDKVPARPFDRNRAGLSVGEAAAYALFMSEERARREQRDILGELAGWGMSDDANHMTGPSRESEGLVRAVNKALQSAGTALAEIGFISAHGTGTPYNDSMEMGAFQQVFTGGALPVYSLKGAIGHTMGAAGLVEVIVALRALRENRIPPTVNLQEADDAAEGWVLNHSRTVGAHQTALVTNAGFSGVNTALVLTTG